MQQADGRPPGYKGAVEDQQAQTVTLERRVGNVRSGDDKSEEKRPRRARPRHGLAAQATHIRRELSVLPIGNGTLRDTREQRDMRLRWVEGPSANVPNRVHGSNIFEYE